MSVTLVWNDRLKAFVDVSVRVAPHNPVGVRCAGCGGKDGKVLWPDMGMSWCQQCGGSSLASYMLLPDTNIWVKYWYPGMSEDNVEQEWRLTGRKRKLGLLNLPGAYIHITPRD